MSATARILTACTNALAVIGIVVIAFAVLFYYARDDLAAWYRQLPVAVFAKCPGVK